MQVPRELVKCKVDRHWIRRFLMAHGWSTRATNTNGTYLPYDDFRMQETRDRFKAMMTMHGCPPGLVLNFDQLWKSNYKQANKLLFWDGNNKNTSSKMDKAIKKILEPEDGEDAQLDQAWEEFGYLGREGLINRSIFGIRLYRKS
jgi:hypothetical protein